MSTRSSRRAATTAAAMTVLALLGSAVWPSGCATQGSAVRSETASHRERLARSPEAALEAEQRAALGNLPATFRGVLPCADCPGIRHQLNLHSEGVFFLRREYLDRDQTVDAIGSWALEESGTRLMLWGRDPEPLQLAVEDAVTLRLLDRTGRPIESDLDYTLERAEQQETLEPELAMSGRYRYLADAAVFEECLTGLRLPVVQEGASLALERAYLEARAEPGAPLLARVEGTIALRTPVEGGGLTPSLVVERFGSVSSGETCGVRPRGQQLIDVRWELVRLAGDSVAARDEPLAIYIVFGSVDSRATGFAGCNRFTGSYSWDGPQGLGGGRLGFGPVAATRRACIDGMDEEMRLFQALDATARYELRGSHLELLSAEGEELAGFEARALD